jgi:hypothetical protein
VEPVTDFNDHSLHRHSASIRTALRTLRRWKTSARTVRILVVNKRLPLVVSFAGQVAEVRDDGDVKLQSRDGLTVTSLASATVVGPSAESLPADARSLMKELLDALPSPESEPLLLLLPDETLLLLRADSK